VPPINSKGLIMPIFEYKCKKCSRKEEILQKKKQIFDCECGGKMLPIVSCSTPVFKGSGFYKTDYK